MGLVPAGRGASHVPPHVHLSLYMTWAVMHSMSLSTLRGIGDRRFSIRAWIQWRSFLLLLLVCDAVSCRDKLGEKVLFFFLNLIIFFKAHPLLKSLWWLKSLV